MNRSALAILCLTLGFTAGIFAASSGQQRVLTPFAEAKFEPVDKARPELSQIAVLRGDPAAGPSAMLMKFGKREGRMHVHSSDYDLVVLRGTMKHTQPGESVQTAPELPPGSYWFQPSNQPHADSSLSDECLMYVQ